MYVCDRETRRTQRASLSSGAVQGNFHSGSSAGTFGPGPAVSPDGRWVAFGSAANNLVPDDTNDKDDLFLRDLKLGVTTRFSLATDGT